MVYLLWAFLISILTFFGLLGYVLFLSTTVSKGLRDVKQYSDNGRRKVGKQVKPGL